MRTFFALLLAGSLVAGLIYVCSLLPAPVATSTVHQTIDNHTQVIITNNMPFDWSGAALCILAITALLYVLFAVALPTIRNWRRP